MRRFTFVEGASERIIAFLGQFIDFPKVRPLPSLPLCERLVCVDRTPEANDLLQDDRRSRAAAAWDDTESLDVVRAALPDNSVKLWLGVVIPFVDRWTR